MEKRLSYCGTRILIVVFVLAYYTAFSQHETTNSIAIEKIKTASGKYISKSDFSKFLLNEMKKMNIPGLSIAIINDKKVIFYENLGVKNFQSKEPVDSLTLFEACSLSKPLFAYFTLLLKDYGVLNLDTPIYKLYMDTEVDYSTSFYKMLTARKILNHSSGWINWREIAGEKLKFRFLPGTRSGYSGEGYQFLKRFLIYRLDASDSQLNTYLHQLVVEPIHCQPMDFILMPPVGKQKANSHTATKPVKNQTNIQSQFDAAGGLVTNAFAYSKFIIALMNTNDPIANELLAIQTSLPPENDGLYRSLGFPYKKIKDEIRYYHSGSNIGARAYCHFYRKAGIGLVMLSNTDSFFMSEFAKNILEYLEEEYPY